jgi:hydroxymethylpyrimidine pyrophosphatase-like HAD family hydrolase
VIVLSDVDGTLVRSGVHESSACLALFDLLRANRVEYVLATSRPWGSLCNVLPQTVEKARYCVCADGAITFEPSADGPQVINRKILLWGDEIISRILSVRPPNSSLLVFLDDRNDFSVAADVRGEHVGCLAAIIGSRRLIALRDLKANSGILSVGILGSSEQCEGLLRFIERDRVISRQGTARVYPEVRVRETGLHWCDVTSYLADKRIAVEHLLTEGLIGTSGKVRPIIVLGDGDNDVRMAGLAEMAYCPPWATAAMKAVAREVECEGIEEFLRTVEIRLRSWLGA